MYTRLAYLFLAVLLFGGCSPVGQQWSNFTAYHNTFYNARLSFEEGMKAVEDPEPSIDREFFLPVFGTFRTANNPEPFEEAIRRSADVLRKHPNSRWVDEALLIIGRSYLYLENHVGAEQKFHEVIALESSLTDEAYFWLGRTLVQAEKYDEAVRTMETALERESVSRSWMGRYYLVAGTARLEQGDYGAAAGLLERGARAIPERALEARAWFLVGQVHEALGQYSEAIAAYERVENRTFDVELAYEATVSRVRSMISTGEDQSEALRALGRLERQPVYDDKQAELAYLAGQVFLSEGNTGEAQRRFQALLSTDDTVPREVLGRVHYALAEMYSSRDDLLSAAAHYDSATVAVRGPSGSSSARRIFEPGALVDLEKRRHAYQAYSTAQTQVNHLDSLLHLAEMPEEEFEQFVLDLRQQITEEREAAREQPDAPQSASWDAYGGEEGLIEEAAELDVSDADPGSEGFLFHRDRARVQEGQAAFMQRWGDRPLTPNWRRRSAARMIQPPPVARYDHMLSPDDREDQGTAAATEESLDSGALAEVDVSEVPRGAEARAEMVEQRTRVQFEAANALFLHLDRPDSAAVIYDLILKENPDRGIAVRAHYALAETQRVLGNTERAEVLYRELAERYPDSEFASRAREQAGETLAASSESAADIDAELQFREALSRWDRGEHVYALGSMLVLAERHRETSLAPRALFAAARIYRQWADHEGINPMPPLSAVLPDPVLEAAGFELRTADVDANERSDEGERPDESGSSAVTGSSDAGGSSPVMNEILFGMRIIPPPPVVGDGPTLKDIYRRLLERYPDSEQAGQAERALAILDPDWEESTPEDVAVREDETREVVEADPGVEDEEVLPGPEDGSFQSTIDWEAGRWTVVIVSWPQIQHAQQSASTFRNRLADEGVEVDILELENEQGDRRYHVGVSQFATENEAHELLEALKDRLPDQARVEQVQQQGH